MFRCFFSFLRVWIVMIVLMWRVSQVLAQNRPLAQTGLEAYTCTLEDSPEEPWRCKLLIIKLTFNQLKQVFRVSAQEHDAKPTYPSSLVYYAWDGEPPQATIQLKVYDARGYEITSQELIQQILLEERPPHPSKILLSIQCNPSQIKAADLTDHQGNGSTVHQLTFKLFFSERYYYDQYIKPANQAEQNLLKTANPLFWQEHTDGLFNKAQRYLDDAKRSRLDRHRISDVEIARFIYENLPQYVQLKQRIQELTDRLSPFNRSGHEIIKDAKETEGAFVRIRWYYGNSLNAAKTHLDTYKVQFFYSSADSLKAPEPISPACLEQIEIAAENLDRLTKLEDGLAIMYKRGRSSEAAKKLKEIEAELESWAREGVFDQKLVGGEGITLLKKVGKDAEVYRPERHASINSPKHELRSQTQVSASTGEPETVIPIAPSAPLPSLSLDGDAPSHNPDADGSLHNPDADLPSTDSGENPLSKDQKDRLLIAQKLSEVYMSGYNDNWNDLNNMKQKDYDESQVEDFIRKGVESIPAEVRTLSDSRDLPSDLQELYGRIFRTTPGDLKTPQDAEQFVKDSNAFNVKLKAIDQIRATELEKEKSKTLEVLGADYRTAIENATSIADLIPIYKNAAQKEYRSQVEGLDIGTDEWGRFEAAVRTGDIVSVTKAYLEYLGAIFTWLRSEPYKPEGYGSIEGVIGGADKEDVWFFRLERKTGVNVEGEIKYRKIEDREGTYLVVFPKAGINSAVIYTIRLLAANSQRVGYEPLIAREAR